MFDILRKQRGWKYILTLGILGATVAGIVLGISLTRRYKEAPQIPLSTPAESAYRGPTSCAVCHAAEYEAWLGTDHALASSREAFRTTWTVRSQRESCLRCHTTGYDPTSGEAALQGVSCEECHGTFDLDHPPSVMTVASEAHVCGECHWTTYNEWQLSTHAKQSVTCVRCHAVHSQSHTMPNGRLPCAECHQQRYDDFAHATHASVGADCETCHMHAPPADNMINGQVSTGHTFTVGVNVCATCHRDRIHTRHEIPSLTEEVSKLRDALPSDVSHELSRLEGEVNQLQNRATRNLYLGGIAGGILGAAIGLAGGGTLMWILEHHNA